MTPFDPQQLLALNRMSGATLGEVGEQDPELYGALSATVAEHRRASVDAAFTGVSAALRGKLSDVDLGLGDRPGTPLRDVLLSGLSGDGTAPEVLDEAARRIVSIDRGQGLSDPAAPEVPLREHPLFQAELRRAEVLQLGLAAQLDMEHTVEVLAEVESPTALDDNALRVLVRARALDEHQARALGQTATLFHLAAGDLGRTQALRAVVKEPSGPVLAGLGSEGWLGVLRRGRVTPPDGITIEQYADRLDRTVSGLFPTDALMARVRRRPVPSTPEGERAAEVNRLVDHVYRLNPEVELLTLDYSPGSADVAGLTFGDLDDTQRGAALGELRAYQRIFAITDVVEDTERLRAAGYGDPIAIARDNPNVFKARTGLSDELAKRYVAAAKQVTETTTAMTLSIVDIFLGGFIDLQVANFPPAVEDFLRNLDGFADLFGSQDFCSCTHCRSILGPAAYFADLMSFVDSCLGDYFTGTRSDDPLKLRVRRPDLWDLPLTCENTSTLVPYLDIVNEICESYLARRHGYTGDLRNRAAVEDLVYRQRLATAVDSFRQPFTLPLVRLDAYLAHVGHSRAEVARTLARPAATVAAARLGLSTREYQLLTQANQDPTFLAHLYGGGFTVPAAGVVAPLDAGVLARLVGISRGELGELTRTRFVSANGTEAINFVTSKSSTDAVQNDIEQVHGLRAGSLDRLHRFARLVRALPWSATEVDLVLGQFALAGVPAGLGEPVVAALVDVLDLHDRFGLPVEQNCALWSPVPTVAATDAGPLFERLFNVPTFVRIDGTLPKPTVSFVHPSLRTTGTPSPADNTLHRLLAALNLGDEDLTRLIVGLAPALGANLGAADENARGFLLTAPNLTLLYRHALLARLLQLSVADLLTLLDLAGLPNGCVAGAADLRSFLELRDWWTASGFRLDDLRVATGRPVPASERYRDPATLARTVVQRITASKALEFADTVFAFLPGVTETQSQAIIGANSGLFERTPSGTLRLVDGFDPAAPLVVPAGPTATVDQVRAVLLDYHTSRVLPVRLAAEFGTDANRIRELVAMTGVGLGSAAIVQAVKGADITPLVDLARALVPLVVLFQAKAFDAEALAFVRTRKEVFGVTSFASVSLASVRSLSVYARYASPVDETETAPPLPPTPDPVQVRYALGAFTPADRFTHVDKARLAAALGTEAAQVATLLPHLTLPATAPEAFAALGRAVTLAGGLGLGGDALGLAVSADYAELHRASQAVLAAIRARYPDEKEFTERLGPAEDLIRSRRRDALVDHMVRSLRHEFSTVDDIYEYLLVDPQWEGCARTSRVVAAISSVQLYVNRIMLNLEQDRRSPTDPARTAVPPTVIPAREWEWRRNYRVWEANRKVFLWPENYLEPDLRDDKTPLFEQLESALLQQQINPQNVLDAYASYLDGFDEVSALTMAGSFHSKDARGRTDVLHLFGVTASEPPVYYHRAIENAHYGETEPDRGTVYGPWRRIEVQIPVRQVSPVVHMGRLFLFWVEVTTTPTSTVSEGSSQFTGYKHRMTLRYTTLRLDGRWSPPQSIALLGSAFAAGEGIVLDPLVEKAEQEAFDEAKAKKSILDILLAFSRMLTPRYDGRLHVEPIDDYTLSGLAWDRIYPDVSATDHLVFTGRNFQFRSSVDFVQRRTVISYGSSHSAWNKPMLSIRKDSGVWALYSGASTSPTLDLYPEAVVGSDSRHRDELAKYNDTGRDLSTFASGRYVTRLARLATAPRISVVNGSAADAVLEMGRDTLYVQSSVRPGGLAVVKRLGTTLAGAMTRTLFTAGVPGLLATSKQIELKEPAAPLTVEADKLTDRVKKDAIDFDGAYGSYFHEIFFHVPFLLAHHLNGQHQYESAQLWYRFIFDPTAAEDVPVPPGTTPAAAALLQRDRVWRFIAFRNAHRPTLRQILTNRKAIAAYNRDPFNPHAIARIRPTAYQKAIVMRYVDNLLDWGDSLFTQFTTESVNEATMLYVMAAEILGRRPAELGACGEGSASTPLTYQAILDSPMKSSEFLTELVNVYYTMSGGGAVYTKTKRSQAYTVDSAEVAFFAERGYTTAIQSTAMAASAGTGDTGDGGRRVPETVVETPGRIVGRARVSMERSVADDRPFSASVVPPGFGVGSGAGFGGGDGPGRGDGIDGPDGGYGGGIDGDIGGDLGGIDGQGVQQFFDWNKARIEKWGASQMLGERLSDSLVVDVGGSKLEMGKAGNLGYSMVTQIGPAFCVPPNPELRAYWDRVEDRLYKIRHCLDITGVPRQLALFAPEIDPRLLVRARAAGLSLADILAATSGDLPPYRFAYLIERAKQHAAAVQAFGTALLSALERRDVEELNRLRSVHQQNLLALSTRVREWELDVAANAVETLDRQIEAATFRRDYYAGLIQTDLIDPERVQQITKHVATASLLVGALLNGTGGILSLVPNIGAPMAITYGGKQTSSSVKAFAAALGDTAKHAEVVSSLAEMEGSFARRRENWGFQRESAQHDLDQLTKQREAVELRRLIAERSLELHQRQIEQHAEVFEFYRDRFTNLSLYTWFATTLQRLYREAYTSAYATARLAEQAYRFERDDNRTSLLRSDYYDATRGGLLAGEQLLVDLEHMERRFIETNYRGPEVDQSFSLGQIDPAALVTLRETGECTFSLHEVFFDLFYPGQFRRRIRAVRLTIPAVTGPYVNVGARLTLTGSKIRRDPNPSATGFASRLTDEPLRRSVSIATSTAQGDAGVFEFSFRDERYMPFEGAGAVSTWQLALPKTFRAFDYHTITDVIVQMSYTAEYDGMLKNRVEELTTTTAGVIATHLRSNSLVRVFSLRQDFSSALNRLVHSPANTPVLIELTDRHVPIFLRGRPFTVSAAKLAVRTANNMAPGQQFQVRVGTSTLNGFTTDSTLGGMRSANIPSFGAFVGTKSLTIVNADALAPNPVPPGDPSVADAEKLLDLLLVVELRMS